MNQVIVWGEKEGFGFRDDEARCMDPKGLVEVRVIYHWPVEEYVDGAGMRRLRCRMCGETCEVV